MPVLWSCMVAIFVVLWANPVWARVEHCVLLAPVFGWWLVLAFQVLAVLLTCAVGMGRRVFYTTFATVAWFVVLDLSIAFASAADGDGAGDCWGRWWMQAPEFTSGEAFGLLCATGAACALLWHTVPYVWRPASKPFVRWLGASWLHRSHAACLSGVIALVVVVQVLSVLYNI